MAEKYEVVCTECSKTFETEDECANVCPDCWEALISGDLNDEGKGD